MLIQCPNCDTKYNLNESSIGQEGSKVRCIRCDHVFFVAPPGADSSKPSQAQDQARKADRGQESKEDYDWLDEADQEDVNSGVRRGKDGYFVEIQASEEPKGKSMTYAVVGIVVAIILMAALLFAQRTLGPISTWFGGAAESETVAEPEVLGPEDVHLISLQNVRQYFVTNEKIGQLFVIEGKARNDFAVPMELFRIEASLFDAAGQVVERREFLAGNTVSLFQLQILSEQELEAALSARVGILTNNTNIRPGMDVQFMVVFSNPSETVQEYGLKVIGAQHPPN